MQPTPQPTAWTHRYDKAIEAAAHVWQIDPALLRGIMARETTGSPRAESSAGAVGLGQFMPGTAEGQAIMPGGGTLKGSSWDLRTDPIDSIYAAAGQLRSLIDTYGNNPEGVIKAVAAYNEGMGNEAHYGIEGPPGQETAHYWRDVMATARVFGYHDEAFDHLYPVTVAEYKQRTAKIVANAGDPRKAANPELARRLIRGHQMLQPGSELSDSDVYFPAGGILDQVNKTAKLLNIALHTPGGQWADRHLRLGAAWVYDLSQRTSMASLAAHEHGLAAGLDVLHHGEPNSEAFMDDTKAAIQELLDAQASPSSGWAVPGKVAPRVLYANQDPAAQLIEQLVVQTAYDPQTLIGGLGFFEKLHLLGEAHILPTALSLLAKGGQGLENASEVVARIMARARAMREGSNATVIGYPNAARPKVDIPPQPETIEGRFRDVTGEVLPPEGNKPGEHLPTAEGRTASQVRQARRRVTLDPSKDALEDQRLYSHSHGPLNSPEHIINAAGRQARERMQQINGMTALILRGVHQLFGVHSVVKDFLASRADIGAQWVHAYAEGLQAKHAATQTSAFIAAIGHHEIFGSRGALVGMAEPDKMELLYHLRNPIEEIGLPLGLARPYYKTRQVTHTIGYLMGDGPLREWLVRDKGFRLPAWAKPFDIKPGQEPRGLMHLPGSGEGEFREDYITLPHMDDAINGDKQAQNVVEQMFAQAHGAYRTFSELRRIDPYLRQVVDPKTFHLTSEAYFNALMSRIKIAGQVIAAHDLQLTAKAIAKKWGFLEDWEAATNRDEGHAWEDFFRYQRITGTPIQGEFGGRYFAFDPLTMMKGWTDWGKVPMFWSGLPHISNIMHLILMTHPGAIPQVAVRFAQLMHMDDYQRLAKMLPYIRRGLVGPMQGIHDFAVASEAAERGSPAFMRQLRKVAEMRLGNTIFPALRGPDGRLMPELKLPNNPVTAAAKALYWIMTGSQKMLWTWDEAAKTVIWDIEHAKLGSSQTLLGAAAKLGPLSSKAYRTADAGAREARATYEVLAKLIDYSSRAGAAEPFRAALPFVTWLTKMPIAVMRAWMQHPELIALITRLDPSQGGQPHSFLGDVTRSTAPLGEFEWMGEGTHLLNRELPRAYVAPWLKGTYGALEKYGGAPAIVPYPGYSSGENPWITYNNDPVMYLLLNQSGALPIAQTLFNMGPFQSNNQPVKTGMDLLKGAAKRFTEQSLRQVPYFPPSRKEEFFTEHKDQPLFRRQQEWTRLHRPIKTSDGEGY